MKPRPLAFGIWQWELPGSALTLIWDGPGSGLSLASASVLRPVSHPTASGQYQTREQADKAVAAFIAAGAELTRKDGT